MTLPVSRKPKLAAFDLDGTLTQHKTPLSAEARDALDALRASGVALMMAGAGDCRRIFRQMGGYPIDVVGNYGMQYAEWDAAAGGLRFVRDECVPCDRAGVLARADAFRAAWVCAGNCSKAGHPHHPLYLKKDEQFHPFDLGGYLT